ncbi:PstS family phosphate ABC transporter substrate-binding protein [Deferribacterales bacterium Es71-Z0220]|uniref:PstS family phosphate ABC transporter substrate-binding protein n=1 Tax=Deferrivibrio essentukiensis TaxID=2880922 RepID=UPI001F60AD8A|nr:PstS family phosphate ABC transporter substrate-binding protein [Deferrivibrio essentukiensis]MCB4204380.1 PstS family phosphate ABC transporter substrate-binding protein [Deferrivibrio essentukiensis]
MKKSLLIALVFMACLTVIGVASARDQIRIVGSSTVYPFSSYVAEEFGATTNFKTPVVESTGSGGGHKLFSEGVGEKTPDITNSSRRIKEKELKNNIEKGIETIEVKIGFDGIVLAQNKDSSDLKLSRKDILLAVAEEVPANGKLVKNPYKYWNEINPNLPKRKILIYGPPTSSGTRDAFEELALEEASKKIKEYGGKYSKIRTDGVYVPAGENDNLIVQRLVKDKEAVGIFGYSFLEENSDRLKGATVDGYEPTFENISSGKYPISRSLYFYVKKNHLGKIPGIEEYVDLFVSEKIIGGRGVLKRIGLIPLPKADREKIRAEWKSRKVLTISDIK